MKAKEDSLQGHWVLARLGKKVLRPGGKELTLRLIKELGINSSDDVVEFAPGLGFTAAINLKANPLSYTGVELDKKAVAFLQERITHPNSRIVHGNANDTNLPEQSATKVYGEAMLTMQSFKQKSDIVKEAYRILEKGGLYGIHEIALTDEGAGEEQRKAIYKELQEAIKSNVAPISVEEWEALLTAEGFQVLKIMKNPMHLLEVKRLIDDEGFFRSLKFFFNVLTHSHARKRVLGMRRVFRKHDKHIQAIAIVAKKL